MGILHPQSYIAHSSNDYTEIRMEGFARKPLVAVVAVGEEDESAASARHAQHDDSSSTPPVPSGSNKNNDNIDINITRHVGSKAGNWICILQNLMQNRKHTVTIKSPSSDDDDDDDDDDRSSCIYLTIRPIFDLQDLGRHRLRIGVLADPHVNLSSHNGKRLYGSANMLLEKYATKLVDSHDVDCLVLPGDICDTGSKHELRIAANILNSIRSASSSRGGGDIPVYAVIGNHEEDAILFSKMLIPESPSLGYYSVNMAGIHMILLATNSQDSLNDQDTQLDWLKQDLEKNDKDNPKNDIVLVFLHYSLLLHPLHNNGNWDDGLQVLYNSNKILDLLHSYPTVKAVICGHKNVPSIVVDDYGLLHTLSPQLIQVPCGYDIIDVYDNGLIRSVYEIEEVQLQQISRHAAGKYESKARWGTDEHRTYKHVWPTHSKKKLKLEHSCL